MEVDNQRIDVDDFIQLQGYVLDEEILKRIDASARESVLGGASDTGELSFRANIVDSEDSRLQFTSVETLVIHLEKEVEPQSLISLQYKYADSGVQIVFEPKGNIILSAFSKHPDFRFYIDKLVRELKHTDQGYNWGIRTFIFNSFFKRLPKLLLIAASAFLLFNIGYYIYARNVGVNIEPDLIPPGNAYAEQVERAIRSDDVAEKLNVLLAGQLKGFTNVRDILYRHERLITYSLIAIAIFLVFLFVQKALVRIYPLAFYSFGAQKNLLTRMQRKREIWGVAVVIGFLVNIAAGIIITLLL